MCPLLSCGLVGTGLYMEDDNCHGALHRRMNIDQNSILLRLGRSPIQQALIYTKCPSRSFKRRRVVNKRQQLG